MNGAFYIGATGLRAQQGALDLVANNISNMNTPGFKRSEARFATLMAVGETGIDPAAPARGGGETVAGVMLAPSAQVFSGGELRPTGQAMDIALNGDGFIELAGLDGEPRLWRGGALSVNPDGFLAGAGGLPLKGAISVPRGAQDLAIAADGRVTAVIDDASAPTEIGRIEVVLVRDPAALTSMGEGLYRVEASSDLVAAAPGEDGAGQLVQGSIEMANVELTQEMILLMLTQRAYAANAQVVQAGDQLMSIANSLRR